MRDGELEFFFNTRVSLAVEGVRNPALVHKGGYDFLTKLPLGCLHTPDALEEQVRKLSASCQDSIQGNLISNAVPVCRINVDELSMVATIPISIPPSRPPTDTHL